MRATRDPDFEQLVDEWLKQLVDHDGADQLREIDEEADLLRALAGWVAEAAERGVEPRDLEARAEAVRRLWRDLHPDPDAADEAAGRSTR